MTLHQRRKADTHLEVDYTASFPGRVVAVVRQRLALAVEYEPSFVPMMKLFAHFRQVATAACRIDHNIVDQRQLMPGGFYVMPQIKGLRLDGKISRERPLKMCRSSRFNVNANNQRLTFFDNRQVLIIE